jgi:hypothetical protein
LKWSTTLNPESNVEAPSGRVPFSWTAATIAYYEQTLFDYRTVWLNRSNLAFHFGFHDDEHRAHAEALENTNRTLARVAGIGTGDRVLDAGCGLEEAAFGSPKIVALASWALRSPRAR